MGINVTDQQTIKQDNIIQPFQIEHTSLRGRGVTIGEELDKILQAHNYPYPVAHMVAETLVLTMLLSSMLKYDGIFTLQAKGDGAMSMLVSDMTSKGDLRACATFDPERLEVSREALSALKTPEGSENHLAQYLGQGHMAFTVDQVGQRDRYQGIVALEGSSLVDCVQHYFAQSEQIRTGIKVAVGLRDGKWRGGGIMLQAMPENDGNQENVQVSNVHEDDWRRSMVLLGSCTEDELLNPDLPIDDLLFRLFHEDGVRVYDPLTVQKKCRCDTQRVENVVASLPEEERHFLVKDGAIEVVCEFCSNTYRLNPDTGKAL